LSFEFAGAPGDSRRSGRFWACCSNPPRINRLGRKEGVIQARIKCFSTVNQKESKLARLPLTSS
jgi:hypothetical protein